MTLLLLLLSLFNTVSEASENRIKIAVVDTGVNLDSNLKGYLCEDGLKNYTTEGLEDTIGHGTLVTSLLVKKLDKKKYCFYSIKIFNKHSQTKYAYSISMLNFIIDNEVSYVNLSYGGPGDFKQEKNLIRIATKRGTVFSIAGGNDGQNLDGNCKYFPACYNLEDHFHVIGALDKYGNRLISSNYNGPIKEFELGDNLCYNYNCMSGTSMSSPVFLNKLIRGLL